MKVLRSSPFYSLARELKAQGVPEGTGRNEDFKKAHKVQLLWLRHQRNAPSFARCIGFIADWVGV